MIRISKYLRIHILTIAMLVLCTVFKTYKDFFIPYLVMFLHELCHTAAAMCIGLKISHITFYPFGVNLKLKNKMIYSLSDEIILYASGPLFNVAAAFVSVLIYRSYPSEELKYFYICNIMLFLMNMLPAVPLDGGIILKRILSHKLGSKAASVIMIIISAAIAVLEMFLGIYVIYKTRMNFSILLFSALMIGNIFTQKEKYDTDFLKELMFHEKKNKKRIRHIVADSNESYEDIAKKFNIGGYGIVYITNSDGKILNTLTETEIIKKLVDTNVTV